MFSSQHDRNLRHGLGWLIALGLSLGAIVMMPANHSTIFSVLGVMVVFAVIFGGCAWCRSGIKAGFLFAVAMSSAFISGLIYYLIGQAIVQSLRFWL